MADLDLPNSKPLWLNLKHSADPHSRQGDYTLYSMKDDLAIVKYSSCFEAPEVYALHFKNVNSSENLESLKYEHTLLDKVSLHTPELIELTSKIKKDVLKLENGAEGYFLRLDDAHLA